MALARLETFSKSYVERQRQLERESEELRAERDEAIRAAYRRDVPMADIANVLGMSHQRIPQIVRS